MRNSTLLVFSIIKNVDDFVKKGKDQDLFKLSHIMRFKKSAKFYADNSKRMYSDIENGYYTVQQLAVFLLYRYMIDGKSVKLYGVKPEHVQEVAKMFTTKKLKEDLKLISTIHKEMKFKGIQDYFKMKEDGTNIAYVLTKNGRISPVFFIRNLDKALTNNREDGIINTDYEQFIRIAKKIKKTLKGGS